MACIRLSGLFSGVRGAKVDARMYLGARTHANHLPESLITVNSRFMANSRNIARLKTDVLYYRSQHMTLQCRSIHSLSRSSFLRKESLSSVCTMFDSGNKRATGSDAWGFVSQSRCFSSGGPGSSDGAPASSGGDDDDGGSEVAAEPQEQQFVPPTALTAVTVPEVFPNVPVIAVKRNPVFPKFIKMIEVGRTYETGNIARK